MEENLSITNQKADALFWVHKLGLTLFILSIVGIYFVFKQNSEDYIFWASIVFGLQLSGAILMQFQPEELGRKWWFGFENIIVKLGWIAAVIGSFFYIAAWLGFLIQLPTLVLAFVFWLVAVTLITIGKYANKPAGIKNNGIWHSSFSGRGVLAWILGVGLTLFYIQLYWGKAPFALIVSQLDGLSDFFRNKPADKWFLYGTLYTFAIAVLGVKFIFKYRHNRYQVIRTVVVIFSQVVLAYFIPNILEALEYDSATQVVDGTEKYLGYYSANPINTWPLNYSAFEPGTINAQLQETYQPIGMAYLFWGIVMFLVVTPVLTYYVGKRWYCSWICGCGGLAETAGDSFRHLSNKSVKAWQIERWVIHSVMVFVMVMTVAVLYTYLSGNEFNISYVTINKSRFVLFSSLILIAFGSLFFFGNKKLKSHKMVHIGLVVIILLLVFLLLSYFLGSKSMLALDSVSLKKGYGFFVGACFSGIIGVGFYPILGNRVWCRFGCPMAGYMGIFQRFHSKFRITTNGGQCISCGNCSTYCEQGIDVRAYAQKGENIVRASCVGCGICSAVCPRGVLKLENGPSEDRFDNNFSLINEISKKAVS